MYDVEQQKPKQITCDTMKLFLDGFIKMNDKMNSLYHATLPFEIVHMKTLLNGILKEQSSLTQPANPTNHEFVFSGFRHKALMQLILDKGGTIKDDVSKTTTALIVKDKSNSSKKTQKAFQLGVSIFDLNELPSLRIQLSQEEPSKNDVSGPQADIRKLIKIETF